MKERSECKPVRPSYHHPGHRLGSRRQLHMVALQLRSGLRQFHHPFAARLKLCEYRNKAGRSFNLPSPDYQDCISIAVQVARVYIGSLQAMSAGSQIPHLEIIWLCHFPAVHSIPYNMGL